MSVNGGLLGVELTNVPWQPRERCAVGIIYSLACMNVAYKAAFGSDLHITSAYRTVAEQAKLYASLGPRRAAVPGKSDHGLGTAFDLGGGVQIYGSTRWRWMHTHAYEYGFIPFVSTQLAVEPWHWTCKYPIVPFTSDIRDPNHQEDDMFTDTDRALLQNVENLLARESDGTDIRTLVTQTRADLGTVANEVRALAIRVGELRDEFRGCIQ